MIRFYANRFQLVDDDNNHAGALVQWSQECEESSAELSQLLMVTTLGFLGGLFLLQFNEGAAANFIAMACAGFLVLGLVVVLFGHHSCTDHRELSFHANGAITIPRNGVLSYVLGPHVLGDHHAIDQIQSQETVTLKRDPNKVQRYEVWLYFAEGANFPIASSLLRQQAHHLTVVLEKALAEVRSNEAQEAMQGGWAEAQIN